MKINLLIFCILMYGIISCEKERISDSKNLLDSLNRGLIAYYPFNNNSNDKSGNNNHGINNLVTESSDRFGSSNSCLLFYGYNSNVEIQKLSSVDLGINAFSISLWINVISLNSIWGCSFFSKGTNSFSIGTEFATSGLPNSRTNYGLGWDSYGKKYGIYPDILPKNQWCHIVCIKTSSGYDYYVNNKKFSLPYNSDNEPKSDLNYPLIFGNGPNTSGNFHGYLDDIRIYNRPLTQEEITYLANN